VVGLSNDSKHVKLSVEIIENRSSSPFSMNKKNKDWFKPKAYLHISDRISKRGKPEVENFVRNRTRISKHRFFPLVHETLSARKYKKYYSGGGSFYRSHYDIINHKSSAKKREIFYPNHLDAQIYSYYSNKILGKCYEEILKNDSNLFDSIIAYRRIPISSDSKTNKCNIHFANEVFEEIKKRKNCIAVCYDVENFFPSLKHNHLKDCWQKLINVDKLPDDHYNIFKAITHYSYMEISDIIDVNKNESIFKLNHKNDYKSSDFNSYFISAADFREKIAKRNFIKINKPNKKKGETEIMGIPQGTPISAFLANLYLLDFDKFIINEFVEKGKTFYRRYSDDILLIFDSIEDFNRSDLMIREKISNPPFRLKIKEEKTAITVFEFQSELNTVKCKSQLENQTKFQDGIPIRYLGFEFDGNASLIKSASMSRYYRMMKDSIKHREWKSEVSIRFNDRQERKKHPKKLKPAMPYFTNAYSMYTHLGKNKKKSNFLTYVDRAAKVMYPDMALNFKNPIRRQVRRSWSIFNKSMKKNQTNPIIPQVTAQTFLPE